MKLIKPSYSINVHENGDIDTIYKNIELAGRTCYKSEDKITETSAKDFVDKMIKSGHHAMLEHGTVYLDFIDDVYEAMAKYIENNYSKVYNHSLECGWDIPHGYITTNYRVLIENDWLDDLKYVCNPTKYHEKKVSVRFICSRAIANELVRHRVFSYAQESTRYCNYGKDKFEGELTYIIPSLYYNSIPEGRVCYDGLEYVLGGAETDKLIRFQHSSRIINTDADVHSLLESFYTSEKSYLKLLEYTSPQVARDVLPLALKTEIVMTGFVSQWEEFFKLRSSEAKTGKPHPDMLALIDPLKEDFKKLNLIK